MPLAALGFNQRCQIIGQLPAPPPLPVPTEHAVTVSKAKIAEIAAAAQTAAKEASANAILTDYLFVLFDAGETHALLPVIRKINDQKMKCIVLALGASSDLITNDLKNSVVELSSVHVNSNINNCWPRTLGLQKDSIKAIVSGIKPKKVVTGVASEIQGQLLEAYAKTGAATFAYRDNINPEGSGDYFQQAVKVQNKAATVLFSSDNAMNHFANEKYKKVAVGNAIDAIVKAIE